MVDWIRIVILAVVQGIAEFLPISSSGHLVILGSWLGELEESATLVIILHAGTLGSILVVYWRRIRDLLRRDRRVIGLLFVGTLPAVGVGLTIKLGFPELLHSPPLAGAMLLVTGAMLIWMGRLRPSTGEYVNLGWRGALLVGCFQAVAILPGISRSGSTILGGRLMGLRSDDSVTFSFLLAIPAILGAAVLAARDLLDPEAQATGEPPALLFIGALIAFLVGILALRWLIRWSDQARLHWFAAWCIPAGLIVLAVSSWQASRSGF